MRGRCPGHHFLLGGQEAAKQKCGAGQTGHCGGTGTFLLSDPDVLGQGSMCLMAGSLEQT